MSAKIHDIRSRAVSGEGPSLSSLQTKIKVYQRLTREWASELNPFESRVLLAIIDRTIGWGEAERYFSGDRLLNGDGYCGPLNMSRPTLYRALARLEKDGFISRRHRADMPDKVFYSVCLDRRPTEVGSRSRDATRCSEGAVSLGDNGVSDRDGPVSDGDPIYSNPLTGNHDTGNHCAALADREPLITAKIIRERNDKAVSSRAKAETDRQEPPTSGGHAAEVEAAWREALRETFPDAVEPVWTGREKAQSKRLAKGWAHARQIAFTDFTDWAVRNWTAIMRKQFKWMTKASPPAVPAFSFYVALIDQFTECWGEGKLEEWASAKERTEVEQMMSRGMTFEQATTEFAKNNVARGLREEMRKREIKVRARSRAADAKLKQAEQLVEFGGAAPVHPRSIAAQEMRAKAHQSNAPATPAPERPDQAMPPLSAPMVDPNQNPFD